MDGKNELVKAMMDVEYYPPSELVKMNIDLTETQKFPIEKAATLGVAFQPIIQLVSYAMGGAGQSGMYFVNTAGKTMFQSGGQFIGNLQAANGGVGGGLARMTQVPLDPTMLCMAVALMAIEKKLDAIHEAQKDILAFLELKEEAKLKGNLNALTDILNNYKFNWDNDKYKDHKHILVQDIKREAEQSIILYREQLTKELNKKALFRSGQEVKSTLNKTMSRLNDYQLALYTFSFSSFLEVMLLENFDTNYLKSIASKIQEYSGDYIALYEKCAEKIEKDSKTSLEGYALKGLSKLSNGTGKMVEKIPVISKSQIDENFIKVAGIIQDLDINRTQKIMQILMENQTDYISSFVESILTIDNLFNQTMQLMFDSENIYIAKVANG
ncbi:hypothetical protein [Youngiibacter multivorans]|uniref:TerB family tellurite resistance protein n=1 Tax=Youngiibacter multivorans TaxID=937251 RepID=A0ABS4G0W3_9CLOT|nr:hypothetical protein [Youngiibacter multivorans]MBP1918189.1 hypothetical protein [Youngiibacter multivorans]